MGATVLTAAAATAVADAAGPPAVYGTRVATAHPTAAKFSALEGGATDGQSWFSAALYNRKRVMIDPRKKKTTKFYTSVELLKTPLSPNAFPQVSARYPEQPGRPGQPGPASNALGHANGMTYNQNTKQLIVSTWTNDYSRQFKNQSSTIKIVDPATLQVVDTKVLDHPLTSICFDWRSNRYVGRQGRAKGDVFTVYNASFKVLKTFRLKAGAQALTSQSADCDQSYIYAIRSPVKGRHQTHNLIYVVDYNGRPKATYSYATATEGEHLAHHAGLFYAGFNIGSGQLFALDRFQYTVLYDPAGGTGTMDPTIVLYGHPTKLRPNGFKRPGYTFVGWTLKRSTDDAVLYVSTSDASKHVWAAGATPDGYKPAVYKDNVNVARTIPKGVLTLSAVWTRP